MNNIFVDMNELAKEIKNEFMIQAYQSLIPDKKGKEFFGKTLKIFAENGISADKAMSILIDISNMFDNIYKEQK